MSEKSNPSHEFLNILLDDENKIVIALLIYVFGTLNLKILAKLMGKSEPPVLRWIKKMLDDDLLIIDNTSTKKSRGKFYKLSKKTEKILDIDHFPIANDENMDSELKREQTKQGMNLIRSLGILSDITSQYTLSMYEKSNTDKEFLNKFKEGGIIALSSFSTIHFKNKAEVKKFKGMLEEFMTKIEQEFDSNDRIQEPQKYSHSMNFNISPIYVIKQMIEDMKKDW